MTLIIKVWTRRSQRSFPTLVTSQFYAQRISHTQKLPRLVQIWLVCCGSVLIRKGTDVLSRVRVPRGVTLISVPALAHCPLPSQGYFLASPEANWKCWWRPFSHQGCKKGHLCLQTAPQSSGYCSEGLVGFDPVP